jgi:hypothetical protein
LEASAKDAKNVDTIFNELLSDIRDKVKNEKFSSIKASKSENKSTKCCVA